MKLQYRIFCEFMAGGLKARIGFEALRHSSRNGERSMRNLAGRAQK